MIDHDELAAELYDAAANAQPVPLLTERFPDLVWEDARRIARATDRLRSAVRDVHIGYKLGWTSAAMREALGIDRPNWGTLWESQVLDSVIDLGLFIHPKVEPELVFRCGEDGRGEWALGLEVVDPRFPSFSFDALDNTADNSSSAALVIGEFGEIESPETVEVTFSDGDQVRSGLGSNAMDSPARAVDWFREQFAVEGGQLEAGKIVFTGGLTAPFDVAAGQTYTLTAPGLAPVELRV